MAVPLPKEPERDEETPEECVFRPVRGPDGRWSIEQLPLTLDVLLHPRKDDHVPQSDPHTRILNPLVDVLRRYLERQRQPDLAVFTDLLIIWGVVGLRNVSPDVSVVEGLADRRAVDRSLDLGEQEGARVRLVVEVVSPSSKLQRAKDEEHNPEVFRRAGVEDLVLVYPPRPDGTEPLRLKHLSLDPGGRYREARPDRRGRFLLRSVGLRISADGDRLALEDAVTGDRLLSSEEAEAAAYRAEIRAASEAAARREAEAELARLREEVARLRAR